MTLALFNAAYPDRIEQSSAYLSDMASVVGGVARPIPGGQGRTVTTLDGSLSMHGSAWVHVARSQSRLRIFSLRYPNLYSTMALSYAHTHRTGPDIEALVAL